MKEPTWPVVEKAPPTYTARGTVLPADIRVSLNRYARYGVPTGNFLRAVLSNDLQQAMARADTDNLRALPAIVAYVYNCLPRTCWGSLAKVQAHIDYWFPISDRWFQEHAELRPLESTNA